MESRKTHGGAGRLSRDSRRAVVGLPRPSTVDRATIAPVGRAADRQTSPAFAEIDADGRVPFATPSSVAAHMSSPPIGIGRFSTTQFPPIAEGRTLFPGYERTYSPGSVAVVASPRSAPSSFSDLLQSSDGFMNYMMSEQRNAPENSHFVGRTSHCIEVDEAGDNPIDIEEKDADEVRTEARLIWKPNEDGRVMSAWLKHSIDSLRGNNKKSEKYWTDVQKEYNQVTVRNRWRTTKQVKDRWHKINKLTSLFNDCWLKAKRVYTSGYSDEMWLEKAHKFFEEENKGLRFQLMNVWYMVRNEAKWMSYNDHSQGKRKEMEKGNTKGGGLEDVDLDRPIGQKAAKRSVLEGKIKSKSRSTNVEELDRFEKIQNNVALNRMKALEMQGNIHRDKIEANKIALQAAKEEKEAKMLETYSNLLKQDTSEMPEDIRTEHVAALKCFRNKLFAEFS